MHCRAAEDQADFLLTIVTAYVLTGKALLDFVQAAFPSVGGRRDFLLHSSLRISLFTLFHAPYSVQEEGGLLTGQGNTGG